MDKEIKRRNIQSKPYEFIIDVEYIPFPSEQARKEAYYTHAKLFLRAKEREAREQATTREQDCIKIHDNSFKWKNRK